MKWLLTILLVSSFCHAQTIVWFSGNESMVGSGSSRHFQSPNGGAGTMLEGEDFMNEQPYTLDGSSGARSGNYCYRFYSAVDATCASYQFENVALDLAGGNYVSPALWGPLYCNFWFKPVDNGNGSGGHSDVKVLMIANAFPNAQNVQLQWNSAGTYSLIVNGTVRATSSSTLATGTWYLCEMYAKWNNSSDTERIKMNGETLTSTINIGTDSIRVFQFGMLTHIGTTSHSCEVDFDDIVLATGSEPDTSARVLVSLPVSDNARGNWLTSSGGTSSLYSFVNVSPPTTYIKNTNASGADNYDVNMQSYTTAGLNPATQHVYAVNASARSGELAHSTARLGTVSIVSNPSTSSKSFSYGNNTAGWTADSWSGSCGCAFTCALPNWFTCLSAPTLNPTVVNGTSPVVRVQKTSAVSAEVDIDKIELRFIAVNGTTQNADNFPIGD